MSRLTQKKMIDEINAATVLGDITSAGSGWSGADLEQMLLSTKLNAPASLPDTSYPGHKLFGSVASLGNKQVQTLTGADLLWADGQ